MGRGYHRFSVLWREKQGWFEEWGERIFDIFTIMKEDHLNMLYHFSKCNFLRNSVELHMAACTCSSWQASWCAFSWYTSTHATCTKPRRFGNARQTSWNCLFVTSFFSSYVVHRGGYIIYCACTYFPPSSRSRMYSVYSCLCIYVPAKQTGGRSEEWDQLHVTRGAQM